MDGTIVDTEPLWIAAEQVLVESHGGSWTEEDSLALVGSDLLAAGEYIRQRAGLPMSAEQVRDHLLAEVLTGVKAGVEWRPGAVELLAGLGRAGVPAALVTMSYRVLAEAVVSQLPAGTFTAVITGDSVSRGKPHPEPYLAAAAELGIAPADCLVVEDSPPGVASGLAAGMRVVGVPNTVAIDPAPGLVLIDSLAGLDVAELLGSVGRADAGRRH
ncbi:HAD family phosphatase [Phytoactinopolyspora alkaliphila]|uniref:HAD family phosphatase n=2 Tax=Phytoactinopolyspora alkaliphila TaxID=1783498 RepID=A0A6N9YGS4_9ACTN|nr:HAD family phosphatase [Phytoactinopolyspora alkaliphila]